MVYVFTLLMYVPLFWGGVENPQTINIASFGIWLLLSLVFAYCTKTLGYPGWRMALGYFSGNLAILGLAFFQGGYTANLGQGEAIALFGAIGAIAAWIVYGCKTGIWTPRVLFWGFVVAEGLSFYPFFKQYWGPNEFVGIFTYAGWVMGVIGPALNICVVERFFAKLRTPTNKKELVESSLYSFENLLTSAIVTILMTA